MNRDFFFISDFQLLQTHKFGTGFVLDLSFTIIPNTQGNKFGHKIYLDST